MSEGNVELVHSGLDAANRGGIEAMLHMCDPEIEWIAIPGSLPDAQGLPRRPGAPGLRRSERPLGRFEWEAEVPATTAKQLLVALKLHASGRASGIEGEFRIFQAWTIRDGKLTRLESYLSSRDQALEPAGLSE